MLYRFDLHALPCLIIHLLNLLLFHVVKRNELCTIIVLDLDRYYRFIIFDSSEITIVVCLTEVKYLPPFVTRSPMNPRRGKPIGMKSGKIFFPFLFILPFLSTLKWWIRSFNCYSYYSSIHLFANLFVCFKRGIISIIVIWNEYLNKD